MSEKAIPQDQLKEIKDAFELFDDDKNKSIDLDEFTQLLKTISPESTKQQAETGFQIVDENGDGHIDFDEFIEWWQTCWWEY